MRKTESRIRELVLKNEALESRLAELNKRNQDSQRNEELARQQEERLRLGESKYKAIFENTGTATVIIEEDKTISIANSEFSRLTGFPLHRIEGKMKWTDFVHPDDLIRMTEQHDLRRQDPDVALSNYEFRLVDRQKQLRYVVLRVGMITGTMQSVASLLDVTHRKRMEMALKNSEHKYRLLVENLTDLIVKVDVEGRFLFVSESYCKMFGKTEDELIGSLFMPLVMDDDMSMTQHSLDRLYAEPYRSYHEQRAMTVYGWRWIAWQNTAVLDDAGQVIEIIGVGRDIHDRKEAEMKILEHERQLSSMVSNLPGFIYRCDYDENWTMKFISHQCEAILGYKANEVIENRMLAYNDVIYPEDRKKVRVGWDKAILKKDFYEGEYRIKSRDGSLKWVWERGIAVFGDEGEVRFLEGYVFDITDNKKLIEDLVKAKERAEESDQLKTAFLANMSHEIRTPMNGILGFTELLAASHLSVEENKEYIQMIQRSGERMLNTVNDIITISKIETGQENLSFSEFDLFTEINDTCKILAPEALKKGLILSVDPGNIPGDQMVKADKVKLVSVLTNLLKNAIKFTDKGFVKVICKRESGFYRFLIKDSGIGIPLNRQKAVFEPFIQGDLDDIRALQGSGLGLSISKSYVELMGGKMWLISEPNKGTEFYFTIPMSDITGKKKKVEKVQHEIHNRKLNVLIVEDDYASVKYFNVILNDFAKQLVIVRDGREAIEHVSKHNDIDLILMDIKLPTMNGYDATRKIREFNKDVVIIAQTAYAIVGDREKAYDAGCDDYITKPILKSKLIDVIARHLS